MSGNQRLIRHRYAGRAGLILIAVLAALGALAGGASANTAAVARPATPARAAAPPATCSAPAIAATLHRSGVMVTGAAMVTGGRYTPPGATTALTGLPSFCAAQLRQADSAGDAIDIAVWLPVAWNGRFEGVGGGGYSCGISYPALATGIQSGYASASTDCGVPAADGLTGDGEFDQLFAQSVSEFASTIATSDPDLSRFKQDGGKILIWHGLADQLIFPQGTVSYYQRVQQAMGGAQPTGTFARLFLAPGAQHCASAAGPAPADPLSAVVSWVEHGKAPTSVLGTVTDPTTNAVTLSRPLCAYPLAVRYTGHGSTDNAKNFVCARQD
jgi:Tannase and feruloyl esterase